MLRSLVAVVLALSTALAGCAKQGAPEQVADAFVDAYFRHADQEKAKEYTALGATEMLEKELRDVAQLRKDGYTPTEAGGGEVRRAPRGADQAGPAYPLPLRDRRSGTRARETVRDADVELASIRGAWKVVRSASALPGGRADAH